MFGDVVGILVREIDCIICGIYVNVKLGLIGFYVRICKIVYVWVNVCRIFYGCMKKECVRMS